MKKNSKEYSQRVINNTKILAKRTYRYANVHYKKQSDKKRIKIEYEYFNLYFFFSNNIF